MSSSTVWPARRVGNRILCGRQVDGRYVCQGVIAFVTEDWVRVRVMLPPGMVEDSPGSHVWRQTSRAGQRAADGRGSVRRHLPKEGTSPLPMNEPPIPWRRSCPHPGCRCTALVDSAVLELTQR
jgi:hypothetical protein